MPPPSLLTLFLFLLLLPATTSSSTSNHHLRRLLHHSFFTSSSSPSPSPSPSPHSLPLSTTSTTTPTTSTTTPTTTPTNPFFPSYTNPPPPPPPPSTTALPTFPANISSLALPSSPHSHSHSHSHSKLLPILLILSLLTLSLITTLLILLRRRRHLHHHNKQPPPSSPPPPPPPPEVYLKLCGSGSPDLNPLPPLPKQRTLTSELNLQPQHVKPHDDDVFYSPTYSSSPSKDSDDISVEIQELLAEAAASGPPPPPHPPPPPPAGDFPGPPKLVPVSGPVGLRRSGEINAKTKLNGLHWDKVRASSDRVMVWDQLHPSSFQLNEEMIETLFKANSGKDGRRSMMPLLNEETRVLDPKKSQNVAILLKALNVTEEEVCEALLEGNSDTLGTELLESLLKMAPTKEEEMKLKEYNDESPLKLGPAEKFLKAVLNVPFAFKRVDALLYIATFDSEVEYLRKSFETLEAACQELRNSRIFLKLLEAVLMTGNRMNFGTNRGDAQAFKLDTLLKLADIKGTDGKTTLLHFVVQEIIKFEGSHLSHTNDNPTAQTRPYQTSTHDDIESKKRGLEVISGLGGELTNVKKAASMDSNALSIDVAKLARGIIKVEEVLQLNEETGRIEINRRFSESMKGFLTKAEQDIVRIQSQENNGFSRVKELTEYFHGNLAKEEAHPLRIFVVVRDFLGVLDQVCKEVGKINDRTVIGATRSLPMSINTHPPFPAFSDTHQRDNSQDGGSIVLM